jgi:demethylmenaquinone methyltransferase / 2-methoxy-6-polyprenyl-1,4-benzoquinol methylase
VSESESLAGSVGGERKAGVRQLFDDISHRYDFLNHFLSLGIDRRWRKRAVAILAPESEGTYLDIACGTGDYGFEVLKRGGGRVVGLDFSRGMLTRLPGKIHKRGVPPERFRPVQGDGERLPCADGAYRGATIGFGIRNMPDRSACLREALRVLAPGSRLVILEFLTPRNRFVRGIFSLYFKRILPTLGGLISGHRFAYAYLPDSVSKFPDHDAFGREISAAGFIDVRFHDLTLGLATVFVAVKP